MRVTYLAEAAASSAVTGGAIRRRGFVEGLLALGVEVNVVSVGPSSRPFPLRNMSLRHPTILRKLLGAAPDVLHIEGLPLAPAVSGAVGMGVPTLLDLCDSWPLLYRSEASNSRVGLDRMSALLKSRAALHMIRTYAAVADRVAYINERDREYDSGRVEIQSIIIRNGVEAALLAGQIEGGPETIYMADWTYAPNQISLAWLIREVVPKIPVQLSRPIMLYGPGAPQVPAGAPFKICGYVSDKREALGRARLVVAPAIAGAGTKNKVIEGAALGLPVLTTSEGVAGLQQRPRWIRVADDPTDFARLLVSHETPRPSSEQLAIYRRGLSWDASCRALLHCYTEIVRSVG